MTCGPNPGLAVGVDESPLNLPGVEPFEVRLQMWERRFLAVGLAR
jgi:hypothetical protein